MADRASPVRVAHVVQNLAIGGLERVVLNLATHARREKYRPSIVCLGPGGPLVEEARRANIDTTVMGKKAGFRPDAVVALARRLRGAGVRIVHCHNAAPLVYGALAARLAGASVVYTAHGMKTSGARAPVTLERLGLVGAFVTVSYDARRIAIESAGAQPMRVHTIVNGVDTGSYRRGSAEARERVRRSLGLGNEDFAFAIVARLSAAKDHANLFRAFASVAANDAHVRLVVVGDGELRAELERLRQDLRMESRIVMTGSRNDVADLVGAFDAFVLSSYTEGLAMTLLEAMAAELPVIATRVGGNAEVVVDGVTGLVVPPRDADRLAVAMRSMASERDGARAMGRRGRDRARDHFSIESMVAAYEDTYQRVLAGAH